MSTEVTPSSDADAKIVRAVLLPGGVAALAFERLEAQLACADGISRENDELKAQLTSPNCVFRRKLPRTRAAKTHKFVINTAEGPCASCGAPTLAQEHKGYLIVGLFEDSSPGEVLIRMAKEGSTIGGLIDNWAIAFSLALQYGVPLAVLCKMFMGMAFEPSGLTPNPEIRIARSITDYVARWLTLRFLPADPIEPVPSEANSNQE